MQVLYVVTGCDYISFFKGIEKMYFMQTFFKYAKFITSGLDTPAGTLADITNDSSFLAFIRLVGCAYFGKHRSGFSTISPSNLYFSISQSNDTDKHETWINNISEQVWLRITKEEHAIPSWEALLLHWRRSTWVIRYWSLATTQYINMPGE
jgi:hypothetical protein